MANVMDAKESRVVFLCVLMLLCSCARDTAQLFGAGPSVAIDDKGHPTKVLSNLLELLSVKHEGTLQSIVDATQKSWLRPAGVERWELVDTLSLEIVERIKPMFEKLNLIKEVQPLQERYKYALLLGCTVSCFIERLSYLVQKYKNGMRFDELVVLTGQRDLMAEETLDVIMKSKLLTIVDRERLERRWSSVKTEKDMMQVIIEESDLPEVLRKHVKVTVVDAPKKLVNGKLARPTTGDTVNAWMEKQPEAGSCVAISSQPHVLYQQAVLATLLPENFHVETIGYQENGHAKIAETLDALARFLYQENIRRKKFAL